MSSRARPSLQHLAQVSSQTFRGPTRSSQMLHKMALLPKETFWQKLIRGRFLTYIYNKDDKTFFGRTCFSWACIIAYAIMYLVFLTTFTLVLLYFTLLVIKNSGKYYSQDEVKQAALTYGEYGVGLSITPTMEGSYPMIWYKDKDPQDYEVYVEAIDRLLHSDRRKHLTEERKSLGPCGQSPYGYGDKPCILVRINRQYSWKGHPLLSNSTLTAKAPPEVQKWIKTDKRLLWIHCEGFHHYDKEHIGIFKYFPDPPGIDPSIFPLSADRECPLIGVQISNFTHGVSLGVRCRLWHEQGPSSKEFLLFVVPANSSVLSRTQTGDFYGEYD